MFFFNETAERFSQAVKGTIDYCDNDQLRVKALGSIWNATLDPSWDAASLALGQKVKVLGRQGIRLIVAP